MQVYQMQPNFDRKIGAGGEMVIAARLFQRGDRAGAMAALRQARQWDPDDPKIASMLESAGTAGARPSSMGAHASP
jgi:hypothetical protein